MLFGLQAVRDNIRNREGKRVFYLGSGDQLTSEAKDWLTRQRIQILPAAKAKPERYALLSGGYMDEKPEHMTHLQGNVLVEKTHPRIAFRGAVDNLEAEILLCGMAAPHLQRELGEVLQLARRLIACEVLGESLEETQLLGLSQQQLRAHSHRPQDFYGQPHFMPDFSDSAAVLQLNRARCAARQAELAAVAAVPARLDILQALNRLSSGIYILMIREKSVEN